MLKNYFLLGKELYTFPIHTCIHHFERLKEYFTLISSNSPAQGDGGSVGAHLLECSLRKSLEGGA